MLSTGIGEERSGNEERGERKQATERIVLFSLPVLTMSDDIVLWTFFNSYIYCMLGLNCAHAGVLSSQCIKRI